MIEADSTKEPTVASLVKPGGSQESPSREDPNSSGNDVDLPVASFRYRSNGRLRDFRHVGAPGTFSSDFGVAGLLWQRVVGGQALSDERRQEGR